MRKLLLVLSVAALSLTSCSKEEVTDCNCGTIIGLYSHQNPYGPSNGYLVTVVSDCEENPLAHLGAIDSDEWTFTESIGWNPDNLEQEEKYCSLEDQF